MPDFAYDAGGFAEERNKKMAKKQELKVETYAVHSFDEIENDSEFDSFCRFIGDRILERREKKLKEEVQRI